ncbi:MAG: zinc ribbon domain-containing protein [Pseudomonadota bacterium]|nr:zinc ribbon domain-containing protein [Pseudomonadota bacterium]
MPIYDYYCAACGSFEQRRPMKESGEPAACPVCHALSARVLTAPSLNLMKGSDRKAEERNEKSAHAPDVVHRLGPEASDRRHPAHHRSRDYKPHKPTRPWMVGH